MEPWGNINGGWGRNRKAKRNSMIKYWVTCGKEDVLKKGILNLEHFLERKGNLIRKSRKEAD
jgi:hypothetical protein